MKQENKKEMYLILLNLESQGTIHCECEIEVFGKEDAFFEANEIAVEFSGFTLDNWVIQDNTCFTYHRGGDEEYTMIITKVV